MKRFSIDDFSIHPHAFQIEQKNVSNKHWHQEIELVFVEQGWVAIEVDQQLFHVDEKELLVITHGVVHQYHDKDEAAIVHVAKYTPENIINPYFLKENQEALNQLYDQVFMVYPNPAIENYIHQIITSEYGQLTECYVAAQLLEMSLFLLKHPEWIFNRCISEEVQVVPYIDQILSYIETYAHQPISLHMVAKHVGISESYCSKYIKKKTGMSFTAYTNGVKISRAETLLLKSNKSMTEIAYLTGFNSIQTFNRVFKDYTGVAPRTYRKKRTEVFVVQDG